MSDVLSDFERQFIQNSISEIVSSFSEQATLMRAFFDSSVYGLDGEEFRDVGTLRIEFVDLPSEILTKKIDASAYVSNDFYQEILLRDRLKIRGILYQVETMQRINFFGANTHLKLGLVRLYDR